MSYNDKEYKLLNSHFLRLFILIVWRFPFSERILFARAMHTSGGSKKCERPRKQKEPRLRFREQGLPERESFRP